jgi:hypothetical protein
MRQLSLESNSAHAQCKTNDADQPSHFMCRRSRTHCRACEVGRSRAAPQTEVAEVGVCCVRGCPGLVVAPEEG